MPKLILDQKIAKVTEKIEAEEKIISESRE